MRNISRTYHENVIRYFLEPLPGGSSLADRLKPLPATYGVPPRSPSAGTWALAYLERERREQFLDCVFPSTV